MRKRFIAVKRMDETGEITRVGGLFNWVSDAAMAIEQDMTEIHGVQAREAARFCYGLAGCRIGALATHGSGVTYRILVADFTSDGKPVTPGLRVLDYDRREGTVLPDQFMDASSLYPGGKHFDGWYYVLPDGATGMGKRFNGERMRSL